ncbi:MAG: M17 family peptidase N-terminal domain-containing protein, partial [Gaiellaceae bacterium]
MGVAVDIALPEQTRADAIAFLVAQPLDGLDPRVAAVADSGELRGERGEAILLHRNGERVVAAGVGKLDEVDRDALRTAGAAVASELA